MTNVEVCVVVMPHSALRMDIPLRERYAARVYKMNELCQVSSWHIIAYILIIVNSICKVDKLQYIKKDLVALGPIRGA